MQSEVTMEFTVLFSRRKTITLSVKSGKLIVKAPTGTSEERIKSLIAKHKLWIDKRLEDSIEKNRLYSSLDEEKIKTLRKKAREYFTEKTNYYAQIMGLEYKKIKISSAATRFASCSSQGNISYSYRLMLYPESCRDYVVVHELAHLIEMNHSKKFWNIVERFIPDFKKRREELKKVPKI